MKLKVMVFLLAASLVAFGQGRGRGTTGQSGGMGQSGTMGSGAGMGRGQAPMDRGQQTRGQSQTKAQQHAQQPISPETQKSGAFRMLENKTGMTADQIQAMYSTSGAKNFGQFVSAVVVSKNLNLDTQKVLDGLKTQSLGQTLQSLGVKHENAQAEIKKAQKEVKDANKGGTKS